MLILNFLKMFFNFSYVKLEGSSGVSRNLHFDELVAADAEKILKWYWYDLYLVKNSRPDLNNGVRELSKVMDGASS